MTRSSNFDSIRRAALAIVSGGRAGSVPPGNAFQFTVESQFLTSGQTGLAMGVFTAPSGSGQGSATHVKIEFDLPTGFQGGLAGTSSGCTDADGDNTFTCLIGTVNAGQKVKRFLTFTNGTAPVVAAPYPVIGCLSVNQGTGGKGGGAGRRRARVRAIRRRLSSRVRRAPRAQASATSGRP